MDKIYVIVFILLYNIKDVGAEVCGRLKYQKPAIQGRNVTLEFRPDNFQSKRILNVTYDINNTRQSRQFPIGINATVYYIYVDTTMDDFNSSVFYVKYENCFSNTIRLTLMGKSEKRQTTIVDSGQTTIIESGQTTLIDSGQATIVESGHQASGNAFLHWIAAGFGGLVLLTATMVLTTLYLRKITREDSSTLSEEVSHIEVVKPRTVMSNTEGAVTKSEEKTTGTLIYADLDIELLEAARRARREQTPSAPTEYADIRFATRSQPRGQENLHAY